MVFIEFVKNHLMKLKITSLLLILFCTISYAQEDWGTYDLDSIVEIGMPGDVFELDTVIKYKRMLSIESVNDSMSFRVAKMDFQQRYENIETIDLPTDRKSLVELYRTYALTKSEIRQQDPSDSDIVEIKSLIGYKTLFQKTKEFPYSETYLFFIKNHIENLLAHYEKIKFPICYSFRTYHSLVGSALNMQATYEE